MVLEFRDVSLEVDGRRYLDRVSLVLRQGESVVVAGAAGCGKSFVLRLLLALPGMDDGDVVRDGEVIVSGQDVFELNGNDLQRLRRRVGFVMRGGGLIENMDVSRNVALPIHYHFRDRLMDSGLADRRCNQLLQRFGTGHLGAAGLRPVELNQEQRMYVALARAFIVEPFLLLLDDATSGLSPAAAQCFCEHIFHAPPDFDNPLPEQDVGVEMTRLMTTADLACYLAHADRFVLLDDGHLFDFGDRADVEASDDPRLEQVLRFENREVVSHG